MGPQFGQRVGDAHVRDQPEVELGDAACWEDGLAARAGIAGDQPLDIDGRLRGEPLERFAPGQIVDPVADAERMLHLLLVPVARGFGDQGALALGERADMLEPAVDRRAVAMVGDQGGERLDEVPDRAVDLRLQARMDVARRPPPPALARRDQFAFDDALGAEVDRHRAVGALRRRGDDDAARPPHRRQHLGILEDVVEMGRADLLLALGEQDEVDRQALVRRLEGVQRGEEGALGPLLVDRAAAADRAAERVVEDPPLERRRGPLGRIELLDVVHEIDADGALRARVQHAEHGRDAAGRRPCARR